MLQDVVNRFGKTRSERDKARDAYFYESESTRFGGIVGGQERVVSSASSFATVAF